MNRDIYQRPVRIYERSCRSPTMGGEQTATKADVQEILYNLRELKHSAFYGSSSPIPELTFVGLGADEPEQNLNRVIWITREKEQPTPAVQLNNSPYFVWRITVALFCAFCTG